MSAAVINQNYTMISSFVNEDGSPFVVSKPVIYKVYDYNNNFIIEGTGIQSSLRPEEWYANIVIPEGSPIPQDTNNEQYRIDWYAENSVNGNNAQMKATEYFQVIDYAEPFSYDSGLAIINGQALKDTILTTLPLLNYKISIIDAYDNTVYTREVFDPNSRLYNGYYVTTFNSISPIAGITDRSAGICPYLVLYNYETEQGTNTEVHTLYMINARVMVLVNNMRRYLDKARNYDIDPSLRWTDVELIHFIYSGLQRYNSAAPQITNYTISDFPVEYIYLLEKLAEVEALNALYLAEGMRAFEFTGASTSLTVDRTQYISTKMDEINSWLNDNLAKTKALMIRKTNGNGAVGIQLSPVTNGFSRGLNSMALNRLLGWRI